MEEKRVTFPVAVYLILIEDNKILLQQRAGTNYMNGYYGVPSGHVEMGEGCLNALVRETKEEIGVDIKKEDLILKYTLNHVSNREYICLFYTVSKYNGIPKIMEPHKCTDLSFFDLNNLPTNIVPELKKYLNDVANGENYGEIGY